MRLDKHNLDVDNELIDSGLWRTNGEMRLLMSDHMLHCKLIEIDTIKCITKLITSQCKCKGQYANILPTQQAAKNTCNVYISVNQSELHKYHHHCHHQHHSCYQLQLTESFIWLQTGAILGPGQGAPAHSSCAGPPPVFLATNPQDTIQSMTVTLLLQKKNLIPGNVIIWVKYSRNASGSGGLRPLNYLRLTGSHPLALVPSLPWRQAHPLEFLV